MNEKIILSSGSMTMQCNKQCSTSKIEVRFAEFGKLIDYPPSKMSKEKGCLSSSLSRSVQKKCKEKSYCSFNMREEGIVAKSSDCSKGAWLLVRYTCKFSGMVFYL